MDRRDALLWIAIVAAPLAWFVDLVVSFTIEPEPGEPWRPFVMHGITVAAFAVVIAAGVIASAMLRRTRADEVEKARVRERRLFLAVAAMVLSFGSALLVLATAIPKWVVGPGVHP